MTSKLKALIATGCITFLYGIYYWGIPAIVNLPEKVDTIHKIAQKQGYNISLSNPRLKMGLIPSMIIQADDFALLNDDNTKALDVKNPNLQLSLFPLLFKKADIKEFSADNISAQIYYDKSLKLGQYPINVETKPSIKLQHAKIKLDSYKLNLNDLTTNKKLFINGQYLSVDNFNPDKQLKMSAIADLEAENTSSKVSIDIDTLLPLNKISQDTIKLDGHVINLDLAYFTPYAKVLSQGKIQRLSGLINATAATKLTNDNHTKINTYTEIKNFGVFTQDPTASIYSKEKLSVTSEVKIQNNALIIEKSSINGNEINAELSGNIQNFCAHYPNLNLDLKIHNTRAENIIPLLPGERNLVPEIDLYALKQTVFAGDVNGEIKIIGKADMPDLNGRITISDAYLVKPITNAPKAKIDLKFEGKKLLLDTRVPTTQTQYVEVKGPINLYPPRSADLQITSTDNIDFVTAQTILNPLHEILTFPIGPVPIMKLQGHGNINLHVVGTKQNPHGWGKFTFKNTTASFNDIHDLKLENGYGELTFDDENTHFTTHKATINGKPIKVDGTCTLQGVLDFKVSANHQDLGKLLNVVNTSPMLVDIQKIISPIKSASGLANLYLNITGKVKDPKEIVFNKNIFAKGTLDFLSNKIDIEDLPISLNNVKGIASFENDQIALNLNSETRKSHMKITGNIKENYANLQINSNRFSISDVLETLNNVKIPYKNDIENIYTSFTANYSGALKPIELNKITLKGQIHPSKGNNLKLNGGEFSLNNSVFKLLPLTGTINGSPYNISAVINNAFAKKPNINGEFKIKDFDINHLNDDYLQVFLPTEIYEHIKDFKDFQGVTTIAGKIQNNNLRVFTRLNDISLAYVPSHVKLNIASGNILLNNQTLNLNKINTQFGEMPILVDGKISKIFNQNPEFNLYVNAKPTQEFFDQFFNNKAVYPIKMKGDVFFTSLITGKLNNLHTKTNLKLHENSSLYYMGASIGDAETPVNIDLDSNIAAQGITLNRLQYNKMNNNIVVPQLTVSGAITYLPDNNAAFNNLRIKTQSPTDAKIFNIIFRKPIMKQGVFTSDLLLNGTTLTPKVLGKFNITDIDIPFFDSTIKDINLDFKPDKILAKSRGVVLTNEITIDTIAQNKLSPPYIIENINLKLADLNINKLTTTIRDMEAEASRNKSLAETDNTSQIFDLSQLVVKNADVTADTITVRNINAQDLTAKLNLTEKMMLNIENFKFNIAEGSVDGKLAYNLLTHATNLKLNLNNANAQIMTEALFDLKGQIYGSMTGNTALVCNGTSYERCMETLAGSGSFKVADGKIPKLGSLEYLLKAGNLVRGGFTGLSINSIIDIVTPLKTGEFNSISGDIKINNGIIYPINIYSDGKDLNLYITGKYNIVNSLADMQVFGSLSKNITSVFGKVKNASLNTLFNTIPGINRSETSTEFEKEINKIPESQNSAISRMFFAEIYGDINGVDYVKSFKWISNQQPVKD